MQQGHLQLKEEHPNYKSVKISKFKVLSFIFFLLLVTGSFISVRYYPYVFARQVSGVIVGIDRVTQPTTIISGDTPLPSAQVFSFAIAIKEEKGEIMTSSSEDRQWSVVEKGQCVEAKYFPYPPWQLEKAGTYYGARLLKLYDCPKK